MSYRLKLIGQMACVVPYSVSLFRGYLNSGKIGCNKYLFKKVKITARIICMFSIIKIDISVRLSALD
ncbi:MAG: hypothetical protein DWQ05_05970 [Calditrichaeota bacterium]|nr:MAG: hypothetical protein DWQ05_05970 [Calditrichota bacterium]